MSNELNKVIQSIMKQHRFSLETDYKMIFQLQNGFLEITPQETDNGDLKPKLTMVHTEEDAKIVIDHDTFKENSVEELMLQYIK